MRGVRIPHDINGPDRLALGLSASGLAFLLFGLLGAYTILHLTIPLPLRIVLAGVVAGTAAAMAWVRPEGRSLIHWLVAALEYKFLQSNDAPSVAAPVLRPHLALLELSTHHPTSPEMLESADHELIEISTPASELPADDDSVSGGAGVPVYLGSPQVVTFYSAKGGCGRTTLAIESAALLALKGWHRDSAAAKPRRLRVLLADFDLTSANVSVRVGLGQPTILDFLTDFSSPSPRVSDYVQIHAASGLEVLLGSPKSLPANGSPLLGVTQAARILASLKAEGYHFIFVDIGPTLGDLETYLLEASDRIYCVVTPTAASVQDLYRGVEALRRLGLGTKLRFVANKMRDGFDLSEPMGDLGGRLICNVPNDPAFDTAENRHQPFCLQAKGDTGSALYQLSADIYPALQVPGASRVVFTTWPFGRRRRAV
jgi:pilus assembly protein CpaE